MDKGQEEVQPNPEQLSKKEKILALPGQVYDKCVDSFKEMYNLGPDQLLYHTYHETDGSPGHVESVRTVAQLYVDAVRWRTTQQNLDYPNNKCDPLLLYSQAREAYPHIPESELLSVVEIAFTTSAMLHDIGNVAEGINWDKVAESSQTGDIMGVDPTVEMISYFLEDFIPKRPEILSQNMYWTFMKKFGETLGFEGAALHVVQKMGADLIGNTQKGVGFEGNFKQLQFIDKNSQFSPGDLRRIFGLMHEWGINGIREGFEGAQSDAAFGVDPAYFFEGFNASTIEEYSKCNSNGVEHFFTLIEEYFCQNRSEVSKILGIPDEHAEKIPNISKFLQQRLRLRAEIGAVFWPPMTHPYVNGLSLLRFHDEFSIPNRQRLLKESCDLMAARFWDPTLTIADFRSLHERIYNEEQREPKAV